MDTVALSGRDWWSIWSWAVVTVVAFTWALLAAPSLWFFFGSKKKGNYNLPPGPPTWPIIGNVNVLIDFKKPAHRIVDDLSKVHGPIMMLKVGVQNLIFVSDPELTLEFLKNQDHLFANRPTSLLAGSGRYLLYGEDEVILSQQGEHHSFFRKLLVAELLSTKKLQSFQAIRMEEQASFIRGALDASSRRETVDVHNLLNAFTLNVITRMGFSKKIFGADISETSKIQQQWAVLIPEMTTRFGHILAETIHPSLKWIDSLTGVRRGMQGCFRRIDALLQDLLNEHRQRLDGLTAKELEVYEPRDFMDVMLLMRNGEHGNHFTDRIAKAITLDLIVAGSETSSTAIEWAMAELLVNADIMKKVQEEVDSVVGFDRCVLESDASRMPYLAAVVKESFRLHPPLPWLLPHSSRVDCKVGNYDIPAESFINVNVYGMTRSASLWDDPLKFSPDRFLSEPLTTVDMKGAHPQFLPFGAGRRKCPGIGMSSVIVHSTLARLVHSFDWAVPDADGDGAASSVLDMSERLGAIAGKRTPLKARPTQRLGLHLYA